MKEHGIKVMAYSSLVPLTTWRELPDQESAKSDQMKADGENKDSVFKLLSIYNSKSMSERVNKIFSND